MTEEQSTNGHAAEKEDSEWEYEYHETETESFYITLDISSAADQNKLGTKKMKKPDESPPRSPQPNASPGAQANAGPSEPAETPAPDAPAPMNIDPNLEGPREDTPLPEPEDRIQILDLHTHNPLISYRDQLYSCSWASTLGTDVLLTAPTPNFSHPILREEPNVSVLAASSIKLIGRPARLKPKEDGQEPTSAPRDSLLAVDRGRGPPTHTQQSQANFLERLIAIKAKKGEKDEVTVYTQKVNQGSGWRSRRKAGEAIEEVEDEPTPKQRGRGPGGRPMGSRRLKGPRTAKGGLFRDYRPQLWDTPGADIRAGGSSLTPESWDQLAGNGEARQTPATIISTAGATSPLPDNQAEPAPMGRSTRSLSASSASASASPSPPEQPANNQGPSSSS